MTKRFAWTTLASVLALPLVLALPACGGGGEQSGKELEAAAQAALNSNADEATKKAREADEARRKAEFAAKKKKEEEEKAAYEAKMAEIITLPEKMPRNVDAACKELTEAFHEFMLKALDGDDGAILDWYNNRKKETLGERRGKCVKIGSLEAAACQIHALRAAPIGWRDKELDIIARCVEKYAPDKAEAAAKAEAESLAKQTQKAAPQ
jgi:hypothetical protein